ncbi:hypothetical protein CPB83DRAFT_871919 [Crepidotus variabilis]|uniref:AAA+ ATPase domain-containing protein n=1 Tax=Crepidotus variabilis TaxID=179855 RepID=A0A9P6E542_9AGAR|nr:hypothetical protein CPB83DRAFT_871919 [Crepidotus variabilis]
MQTRRGTVLGKRGHHESSLSSTATNGHVVCEQLLTPESTPNPKRARTSLTLEDDASNKENIPPSREGSIMGDITPPRRTRSLRRTSTEIITPSRIRTAIQRSVSMASIPPATPTAAVAALSISTPPPTPPNALVPLHSRIRALLRSTCNNAQAQMAGRDVEHATIMNFLGPFIDGSAMADDNAQSTMFISGSPGTGKTALVNTIIRQLSSEHPSQVRVVSINCMALKSVDALWERMIEDFGDASKKRTSSKKHKGREAVHSVLSSLDAKCLLILDELDHITANEQSAASIFTLTDALPSNLRLIGIANTHTLTSSSNASFTFHNVQTVHFAPYTPGQLQVILQSRLEAISASEDAPEISTKVQKFLPKPTQMLLTKKVAALTGDVRSLFEVLRGAIDLAVGSSAKKSAPNPLDAPSPIVTPQHVLAALKAYTPAAASMKSSAGSSSGISNSETVSKIQNLGLQARVVLLAILLASKRRETGLPLSSSPSASPKKLTASPVKRSLTMPASLAVGIDTNMLHNYYSAVLSRSEGGLFESISRSEFGDVLGVLEGVGILSLSSSLSASAGPSKPKRAMGRSVSFGGGLSKNGAGAVGEVRLVDGVWNDEVLRGLGVTPADGAASDPREEEVRAIWTREKSRLAKDVKAAASALKNATLDVFTGAFED